MKKKILFIINSFSTGGGAESLLARIANNLNLDKYNVFIIEVLHRDIKTEKIRPEITVLPYIMRADDPKRKEKMYYVYHEPWKVFDEFIGDHYDLYVAFTYMRPILLLPEGKRCISWMHGDIYNLLENRDKIPENRQLENKALYKAKKIISASDHTTQSVIDVHPDHKDKLITIYNGIDIDTTREKASLPIDISLQSPSMLFVGRLEENKRPLRLLDILEKVHERNPGVHLYFMGWGVQEEEVKEQIQLRGLEKFAHLLGYQENPFPIITQCDVVCLLSKSEGFPMCLLEGVALDKPFVATDIGGAETLSNHQTCGKIVETDQEAADAIIEFMEMDKAVIQNRCRESIVRFDFDKYIAQIEAVFDEVLSDEAYKRSL